MAGFRRTSGGVSARFTAAQAEIVRTLVSQVAELVGGETTAADTAGASAAGEAPESPDELAEMLGSFGAALDPPEDPVLARLLPDAYTGDPDSAGEFRRLTEQSLRSAKAETARTVLDTLPDRGGRVRLSPEQAQAWLRALNDVRLALGVRLGVTEDVQHEMGQLDEDSPRRPQLAVYDWLTFLQETLVRAVW